jgi:hypothetical protein
MERLSILHKIDLFQEHMKLLMFPDTQNVSSELGEEIKIAQIVIAYYGFRQENINKLFSSEDLKKFIPLESDVGSMGYLVKNHTARLAKLTHRMKLIFKDNPPFKLPSTAKKISENELLIRATQGYFFHQPIVKALDVREILPLCPKHIPMDFLYTQPQSVVICAQSNLFSLQWNYARDASSSLRQNCIHEGSVHISSSYSYLHSLEDQVGMSSYHTFRFGLSASSMPYGIVSLINNLNRLTVSLAHSSQISPHYNEIRSGSRPIFVALNLIDRQLGIVNPAVFTNVISFNGSFSGLGALTYHISCLTSLTAINLSNNSLSKLPDTFDSLKKLELLNLSRNNFEIFPAPLGRLPKLSELDMRENMSMAANMRGIQNITSLCDLAVSSRQAEILNNIGFKLFPADSGWYHTSTRPSGKLRKLI